MRHGLVPLGTAYKLACRFVRAGRKQTSFDVFDGFVVNRHQASARTAFNRHITKRHASFHAEAANRRACELDGVTRATCSSDLANDGQHDVFGSDAFVHSAFDRHAHILGFFS